MLRPTEKTTDWGFFPKVFIRFFPPHLQKGEWERKFGPSSLVHRGEIPSGLSGRRALLYLATELFRAGEGGGFLGGDRSVAEISRWLGAGSSRGARSGLQGVRQQVRRVLGVEAHVADGEDSRVFKPQPSARVVKHLEAGFDPLLVPAEIGGWFERKGDYVPVDMHIVRALGKDLLALDLYMALSYRSAGLRRQFLLTYKALRKQLGADFADVSARVFKSRVAIALRRVMRLYGELRVSLNDLGIMLLPGSRPSVPVAVAGPEDNMGGQPGGTSLPPRSRPPPRPT